MEISTAYCSDAQFLAVAQFLGLLTVPWNVTVPLGVSFHLLIEDLGLVLSAILVPFDSDQFMLCPWAMSSFQKLCPALSPPVMLTQKKEKAGMKDGNLSPSDII